MRRLICFLLGVMLLATAVCALGEPTRTPELLEPVGVSMDFEKVTRGEMYELTSYDGQIVPEAEELYFSDDGKVKTVHVRLGDRVKKGDVLITLSEKEMKRTADDLARRIEYQERTAELTEQTEMIDIALLELDIKRLVDERADEKQIALLRQDLLSLKLSHEQGKELRALNMDSLKSQLQTAEKKMGNNLLVAPCDGRVVFLRPLTEDDDVFAYQKLACVTDDSTMRIKCAQITELTLKNAKGYYALIGNKKYEIEAVPVDAQKNLAISLKGGDLYSEFTFDGDPEDVDIGMYTAVCLISRYVEDAIHIPKNALYADDGVQYVYMLVDGARVRQNVKVGITTSIRAEITEGLMEGDEVYVAD